MISGTYLRGIFLLVRGGKLSWTAIGSDEALEIERGYTMICVGQLGSKRA
jgi:hypothetical protein